MVKPSKLTIFILLIFLASSPGASYGSWAGSQIVITGSWGSDVGQFDFYSGDTQDFFPKEFGVDKAGMIVIPDDGNKRIVIYNPDGTLKNTLYKPIGLPDLDSIGGWPSSFILYSGGNSFAIDCNYQQTSGGGRRPLNICLVSYANEILAKLDIAEVFLFDGGYIFLKNGIYSLYSPTGQLIRTSKTKPLELGVVKSIQENHDGSGSTVIQYPDITYSIKTPKLLEYFNRDAQGGFYGVIRTGPGGQQYYRTYKFSQCGKVIASVDLPTSVIEETNVIGRPTPEVNVIEEYGKPVIAPNGDVYAWKRTPDKYSILKWAWVDDPNAQTGPDAPTGLTVMPSTTGLYLTWSASPQDPGCVTGYEVAQATSSGGVYMTIATVNAGVLKYNDTSAAAGTTYYYKIRAVAGSEYSPYTSEVSGKR